MAIFFYNLVIYVLRKAMAVASVFNSKAALFVTGRKDLLQKVRAAFESNTHPVVWVHCASLGEFEQGRPVMEAIKREMPQYKILLTFFSPSGYELRKNYDKAEWVFYLSWDTASNAKKWVEVVNPALVIFVKYEFWYHFSNELNKRSIPLISIASIFRDEQLFFKSYGSYYRNILRKFSYFFVQNYYSVDLLKSIGITNSTVAGDTRFDRVFEIVKSADPLPIAQAFKGNEKTMVVGSAWPEDMAVLAPFINKQGGHLKFIIAPHEVSETSLQQIEKMLLQKHVRYSQASNRNIEEYQVLIIDNIGMLSKLYRYGEFAFVGGAFGKGLHNILEAACYGIPVFFGDKKYKKYQEAKDLINRGGAFEVADYNDFLAKYELVTIPENFLLACEVTRAYVEENLGATEKIMNYCRKVLQT